MSCPGVPDASYGMRLAIWFDAGCQLLMRKAKWITISSRIGTAVAHDHAWAKPFFWLLDRCWPFGKDADGTSHCCSAFRGDIGRNIAGLWEILGDPVVVEFGNLHGFEPEIQAALMLRAARIERTK